MLKTQRQVLSCSIKIKCMCCYSQMQFTFILCISIIYCFWDLFVIKRQLTSRAPGIYLLISLFCLLFTNRSQKQQSVKCLICRSTTSRSENLGWRREKSLNCCWAWQSCIALSETIGNDWIIQQTANCSRFGSQISNCSLCLKWTTKLRVVFAVCASFILLW